MSNFSFRAQRRRLLGMVILAILVTGVLVTLVTAWPLYQASREAMERVTVVATWAHGEAIARLEGQFESVAEQFTSRTEIRRRLEWYADGELSLEELITFTRPRLLDAKNSAPGVAGMMRLGPNGEVVVREGLTEDPDEVPDPPSGTGNGTVRVDETLLWRATAPIHDPEGRQVGVDVLYFDPTPLRDLLLEAEAVDDDLFGPEGLAVRARLLDRARASLLEVGPDGELAQYPLDTGVATALGRFESSRAGFLEPEDPLRDGVVAYARVGQGDRLLLVDAPFWDFYGAALHRLAWPLALVLLLLPLVSWMAGRTMRPLLRRLVAQAETLEHQAQELRLAASVFEGTGEAILVTKPDHRVVRANGAFQRLTGYDIERVVGLALPEFFVDLQEDELDRICDRVRRDGSWQGEIDYGTRSGQRLTALQGITEVRDAEGRPLHYIHILHDVTRRKAREQKIRHQALHDPLTDLPNRAELTRQLQQAIERAANESTALALLFLDLDRFKEVNDSLGHALGDELLRQGKRSF
ncbi:MAG: diguanylate cyclase domain-containing protein [Pseudomonadota bacterium]